MSNGNGGPVRNTPVARNRYAEGQILHARDLERESDYFMVRDRQHNALAHSPGILYGLQLVASKRGLEEAIAEEEQDPNVELDLDLYVEAGVAIDGMGRLVVVTGREQVRSDLATLPALLRDGRYRVELYYAHASDSSSAGSNGNGGSNGSGCGPATGHTGSSGGTRSNSVLREHFRIQLTSVDTPPAEFDLGSVLDGPVDTPAVQAPVVLGTVSWSRATKTFVAYSTDQRTYAGVAAQQIRTPDGRAQLNINDISGRTVLRRAQMPAKDAEDPFTPGPFKDHVAIDEDGNTWINGQLSVGPTEPIEGVPGGINFRESRSSTLPSGWRAEFVRTNPGSAFGENPAGDDLPANEYEPGDRELRILLQREVDQGPGEGRHRIVIGRINSQEEFDPALVVYDYPPTESDRGFVTVEVCGDLHVRGTAFLHSVRKARDSGDASEQLTMLLTLLAGPLGGALQAFLTSDPVWLETFAGIMADQITKPGTIRDDFIAGLLADQSFVDAVAAAAVANANAMLNTALNTTIPTLIATAKQQAITDAVTEILKDPNVEALLRKAAEVVDIPSNNLSLPADLGLALQAALVRRILHHPDGLPAMRDNFRDAFPNPEHGKALGSLAWTLLP